MASVFRSRIVLVTLTIVIAMSVNHLWRVVEAHTRLRAAGLDGPGLENVAVELGVAPEQFHMSRLQRWGTMVGADARKVHLRAVSPENRMQIASQSWVASVVRGDP